MRRTVLLALGLAACARRADDPELQGDKAYAAGQYAVAAARYATAAAARPGARVWAKIGAAALHAGSLRQAADAYASLGADDPTRADEAAEGLDQVAHAADLAGDGVVLLQAVLALEAVRPGRPVLRYALAAARAEHLPEPDAVSLLPQAIALASEPRLVDSLVQRYAETLAGAGNCGDAAPAFATVRRRTTDADLGARARSGFAACALQLGRAALAAGNGTDAERWLAAVAGGDSVSPAARAAWLGIGDARRVRGDTAGAIGAFEIARGMNEPADSVGQLARGRLDSLRAPQSAGDSTRTSTP